MDELAFKISYNPDAAAYSPQQIEAYLDGSLVLEQEPSLFDDEHRVFETKISPLKVQDYLEKLSSIEVGSGSTLMLTLGTGEKRGWKSKEVTKLLDDSYDDLINEFHRDKNTA